jgi:hypothetical protein
VAPESSASTRHGLGTVAGVDTQGVYLNASGAVCDDPAGCRRHLVGPQFRTAVTGRLYQAAAGPAGS